jgi:hypothetical protein
MAPVSTGLQNRSDVRHGAAIARIDQLAHLHSNRSFTVQPRLHMLRLRSGAKIIGVAPLHRPLGAMLWLWSSRCGSMVPKTSCLHPSDHQASAVVATRVGCDRPTSNERVNRYGERRTSGMGRTGIEPVTLGLKVPHCEHCKRPVRRLCSWGFRGSGRRAESGSIPLSRPKLGNPDV